MKNISFARDCRGLVNKNNSNKFSSCQYLHNNTTTVQSMIQTFAAGIACMGRLKQQKDPHEKNYTLLADSFTVCC